MIQFCLLQERGCFLGCSRFLHFFYLLREVYCKLLRLEIAVAIQQHDETRRPRLRVPAEPTNQPTNRPNTNDVVRKNTCRRNGVADRVTVIHKSSGALKPGVDLPERGVDVIVTELVDSGLLGERIIPVLTDARARGLLAEGGRVIPEARAYHCAVCHDIFFSHNVMKFAKGGITSSLQYT